MDFYYYFQARENYFWQWEEDGEVLAIPGGNTIAYKDHVVKIMEGFVDQGIPKFGVLLMVMLATNKNPDSSIQQLASLLFKLESKSIKRFTQDTQINDVIGFLRLLTRLPDEYKTGNKRNMLFQALFKDGHNLVNSKEAKKLVSQLAANNFEKPKLLAKPALTDNRLLIDLKLMLLLKQKFPDVDSILEEVAGIKELPTEVDLPQEIGVDETGSQKDFIDTLIDNPKTFHVGILIKRIWAGLNIPYHHTMPSEQPLGGVSDLTNKGQFDKLLVSEFANDDLVFLSRLANNEALYLRREVPPANDTSKRIILIDVSIKNWGTPKILAYSILLAIARHPKTDVACEAYLVGETVEPVRFDNIHGLIDSLQILDAGLHPAKGLELFFKAHPNPKASEIFFITNAETIGMPAMQKVMTDYKQFFRYLINVSAEGNIDFYKSFGGNKKLQQNLKLPLQELWKRSKPEVSVPIAETDLALGESGILYPVPSAYKAKLVADDGEVFVITNEKSLFRIINNGREWNKRKGMELVLENISSGEYEIGKVTGDEWSGEGYFLLVFTAQNRQVELINLQTKEHRNKIFVNWHSSPYRRFYFSGNNFHYIGNRYVWAINQPADEVNIMRLDTNLLPYQGTYKTREDELKKLSIWDSGSILKNVSQVFINGKYGLVFNIHQLQLILDMHIKFTNATSLEKIVEAYPVEGFRNRFSFHDGSTVTFSRSGIVELNSSNIDIPKIFVPTVINGALGVGTLSFFAGNEYYNDEANGLEKIAVSTFWYKYIHKFVEHIVQNAI